MKKNMIVVGTLFGLSVAIATLVIEGYVAGRLTARELGIGLLLFCAGLLFVLIIFGKLRRRRSREQPSQLKNGAAESHSNKKVLGAKIAIAILATLFVSGLFQITSTPLLPLVAGMTFNLLIIYALVLIIRRERKSE